MFSKSVVIAALLLGAFGPVRACAFDIGFGNPFALPHPRSLEVAMAVHGAVQRGGFDVAAAGPTWTAKPGCSVRTGGCSDWGARWVAPRRASR